MITVRLQGGMGNQMFQYALGRVLSLKYSTPLVLDTDLLGVRLYKGFTVREYELDLFDITARLLPRHSSWIAKWCYFIRKFFEKVYHHKGVEKGFAFDPSVLELPDGVTLDGYWQSYKYFEHIADIIKKDFTLRKPLPSHIQKLREKIQSEHSVCLHVRRGDYIGNPLHDTTTMEYYRQAIVVLVEKVDIEHIYVFSDDIAWCREHLTFSYPVTFVGEEYSGERASGHFSLMRACAHFIIANSTFSWWTAWLGERAEKIVIAPKQWFGDKSIDTTDLIPGEWIRV